jgi:hypothetical protein
MPTITDLLQSKLYIGLLVPLVLTLQGCFKATVFGYETRIWPLDGRNELHISTYSSDFYKHVSKVPFLWKEVRSPNSVYFEVFVRQAGQMGPNPHVDSIVIHSFSYAFPGQEPVSVHDGWYVNLEIDLTLNGKRYQLDGDVNATRREYMRPLLNEIFR